MERVGDGVFVEVHWIRSWRKARWDHPKKIGYRPAMTTLSPPPAADTEAGLLAEFGRSGSLDDAIPTLAKNRGAIERIESVVRQRPTSRPLKNSPAFVDFQKTVDRVRANSGA